MQSIIEQINTENEKNIILKPIKENLIELCFDTFGSHVIEKIIDSFEENSISSIYNVVLNNFLALANCNNGLCISKKIISRCSSAETFSYLSNLIIKNAIYLIQNPYGNYTIQMALIVNKILNLALGLLLYCSYFTAI